MAAKSGEGLGDQGEREESRMISRYLERMIHRDFPQVSDRLKNGHFHSVEAAAVAAGIIDEPFRSDHPLEGLLAAWDRADESARLLFLRLVNEDISTIRSERALAVETKAVKPAEETEVVTSGSGEEDHGTAEQGALSGSKPWVELENRLRRARQLPTLPSVFIKVLKVASDPASDIEAMYRVVSTDPSLSGAILRLANSAYYGLGNEVKTLRMALVVLGIREVCRLVSTVSLISAFSGGQVGGRFDFRRFWLHSACTGVVAEVIGRRFNAPNPDELQATGLLHDIGKAFLATYFYDDLSRAQVHAVEHGNPLWKSEQLLYSTDHAKVGASLAESWGLPELFANVIRNHHAVSLHVEQRFAVAAVHLANRICHLDDDDHIHRFAHEELLKDPAWSELSLSKTFSPAETAALFNEIETSVAGVLDLMQYVRTS